MIFRIQDHKAVASLVFFLLAMTGCGRNDIEMVKSTILQVGHPKTIESAFKNCTAFSDVSWKQCETPYLIQQVYGKDTTCVRAEAIFKDNLVKNEIIRSSEPSINEALNDINRSLDAVAKAEKEATERPDRSESLAQLLESCSKADADSECNLPDWLKSEFPASSGYPSLYIVFQDLWKTVLFVDQAREEILQPGANQNVLNRKIMNGLGNIEEDKERIKWSVNYYTKMRNKHLNLGGKKEELEASKKELIEKKNSLGKRIIKVVGGYTFFIGPDKKTVMPAGSEIIMYSLSGKECGKSDSGPIELVYQNMVELGGLISDFGCE